MRQKIVDALYIIIIIMLFALAVYSIFFGVNTSKLEDLCITAFGVILSLAVVMCVLLDKGDK